MSKDTQPSPRPGAGGFRRAISPVEWWFLGHPGELTVTTQIVVEGTGTITAEGLREAVATASAACPGARLVREDRTWVDSGVPPARRVGGGRGRRRRG
ncbi:hypothetical protein, partial [Amycolatopsis sp. NPDC059021]|uniref:hypothetical protein n=1 Tax=Amycolatopsis sp. NPDC059021 TaxID=3346704 RepID=UPI003671A03B